MSKKSTKRFGGLILAIIVLVFSGGCDGLFDNHRMNCPIAAANLSTNDIRFMVIVSGETKNRFGFLGSMGSGATSLGCELELLPNTTMEWEEDGKKCKAVVDTAKYIPKKKYIESFFFYTLETACGM